MNNTAALNPFLDNKGTFSRVPRHPISEVRSTAKQAKCQPLSKEQQRFIYKDVAKDKKARKSPVRELEQRVLANRTRSNKVSSLKRKNIELVKQTRLKQTKEDMTEQQKDYLHKLDRNLGGCASHSLYKRFLEGEAIEYVGSHTCDHKLCAVCNSIRQKRLRAKYLNFFKENDQLVLIQSLKNKKIRAYTKAVAELMMSHDNFDSLYVVVKHQGYDVMHLTLTVPHYRDSGFRGDLFYYDALIKIFNRLRKEDRWNELVYGGEYGIETTNTENGLNIHIHSLLLVKQSRQNRNILHKYLLEQWNKMTVNPYSSREVIDTDTVAKINKSNRLIAKDADFINRLNPKGTTVITLENIYNYTAKGNKDRVVSEEFGSDKMMKAVVEAISYHFEPQCFDKENGEMDLDLMVNIMPELEGKPLYRKFGCLHREKSLNIKFKAEERLLDDFEDSASDVVIHPDTLKPAEREEYEFFITNAASVFHDVALNLRPFLIPEAKVLVLNSAINTPDALHGMAKMALGKMLKTKEPPTPPELNAVTEFIGKHDSSILENVPYSIQPDTINREIDYQLRRSP